MSSLGIQSYSGKEEKWEMGKAICIDFSNLNKACPRDSYNFPKIDEMVDTITDYPRMSFLDAYSGYNQIL